MESEDIPSDIVESFEAALQDCLPDRSAKKYSNAYDLFVKWQESKGTRLFTEPVLMAYFNELSVKYKASTLWSVYSMLKSTINYKNNINISQYCRLIAFIKKKNDGFQPKKSKVFSAEEINKFLVDAPDEKYLGMKTVLVFGVSGACRGVELTNIFMVHVKDCGEEFIVSIPVTKTKVSKKYVIVGNFVEIVRKYIQLRPNNVMSDRFFLGYRNGRCPTQVIGKNSIAKIPKEIASYLNLPDPELYTGHSFRRSSTTILADSGAAIETIKRQGPWKSNSVAEGYIQESIGNKRKIATDITNAITIDKSRNDNRTKRLATTTTVTSSSLLSNIVASQCIEKTTITTDEVSGQSNTTFDKMINTADSLCNSTVATNPLVNLSNEKFGISLSNCSSINIYIGKQG